MMTLYREKKKKKNFIMKCDETNINIGKSCIICNGKTGQATSAPKLPAI